MKPALLIIDMQKDFFVGERLLKAKDTLVKNINFLEDVVRRHHVPIVWVRQEMNPDLSDAPLGDKKLGRKIVVAGTEGSRLVDGLQKKDGDFEIIKTRYSPFYKTNLEELLQKLGVNQLIVAGINTHACVRMAAIDAYERDYEVILALDCISSWDEEHHAVTVRYLSGKLTTPMTNGEIERSLAPL